jgi:hypothetical protein
MVNDVLELLQDALPEGALAEYDMTADAILVDGDVIWPEASKAIPSMCLRPDQAVGLILDALRERHPGRYDSS